MSSLRERWPLVVAGAIALATTVGYARIIRGQQTSSLSDPAPLFVIVYLTLLATAAAVLSGWGRVRIRRTVPSTAWIDTATAIAAGALALVLLVLP